MERVSGKWKRFKGLLWQSKNKTFLCIIPFIAIVFENVESSSATILFADSSSQTTIRLEVEREKYFRTSELWMKFVMRTKVETSVPLMSCSLQNKYCILSILLSIWFINLYCLEFQKVKIHYTIKWYSLFYNVYIWHFWWLASLLNNNLKISPLL